MNQPGKTTSRCPFPLHQIIAVTTDDEHHSFIYLLTGQCYQLDRSLVWFSRQYPGLLRIHRESLVNPRYVAWYNVEEGYEAYLVLVNQLCLLIADQYATQVAQQLSGLPNANTVLRTF